MPIGAAGAGRHVHGNAKDFVWFAAMYVILRLIIMFFVTRYPDSAVSKALTVLG